MISLTYLSSATRPFTADELEALLVVSRANNQAAGLSGMLLYADEHFIQTLEGEADAVDAAFQRISADTRHRNIEIALREELTERRFEGWTMGFKHLSTADVAGIEGFSDYLDPKSELYKNNDAFGRAGVFHRVFRNFRAASDLTR